MKFILLCLKHNLVPCDYDGLSSIISLYAQSNTIPATIMTPYIHDDH